MNHKNFVGSTKYVPAWHEGSDVYALLVLLFTTSQEPLTYVRRHLIKSPFIEIILSTTQYISIFFNLQQAHSTLFYTTLLFRPILLSLTYFTWKKKKIKIARNHSSKILKGKTQFLLQPACSTFTSSFRLLTSGAEVS